MPLGYSRVRVNVTALVKDGNDSDVAPDDEAISATLVLTPMVKPGTPLQYFDAGRTKLKVLTPIECQVSALGDIVNGPLDYVTVPAPDSSNTNMATLQWQASFRNPKYGIKPIPINDIYFYAVPGAEIDLADQVNTAPSSTAVQITRGPRGFGVALVEAQETAGVSELVSFAGPADDPDAWLEVGRTPLPELGGGGGLGDAGIAALVGDNGSATGAAIQSAFGSAFTEDPTRPGLFFPPAGAPVDGALALASSAYKTAALASASTPLKLFALMDSTGDGFGNPGGPDAWAKVWPLVLAALLRQNLGRPAGGRGWIPASTPLDSASYMWSPSELLPLTATAIDALGPQIGIPGSLWLQRGHATNVDEVRWTLSPGVTAVDVVHTSGDPATVNGLVITAANPASSVTKNTDGDRVITRITNPGATIDVHGAAGVGLAALGIIEYVGDESSGVTMWNLSQGSMAAHEYAAVLTDGTKSLKPLIGQYAPHVALVCLGANDYGRARTTAQLTTALETIRTNILAVSPNTVVVFVLRPIDATATTEQTPTATWAQFCTAVQAYAAGVSAPVMDLRESVPASGSALYLADKVHWTAAGQLTAADGALDFMKVGA